MAKPRAGSTARSAAARASPATTSSDPNLPTPTSITRADLSSSGAKAAVASANRSSVGSSSSALDSDLPAPDARDVASIAKEVGKRLAYDDDDGSALPTAASAMQQPDLAPEGLAVLAPLVELPDPDEVSSTIVVSADSTVTQTQVAAPADSTAAAADAEGPVTPVPTEMELVLAELHHARGLTPRSKRLLAALVETASAELDYNPTAATLRIRRAAFWSKVRVGILAATVFSVAAMDVALAVALYGARRGNHHLLPAT